MGEVLAGGGPTVIEEDGPTGVEGGRNRAAPVAAEFGGDELGELRVGISTRTLIAGEQINGRRIEVPELREQRPGSGDERAVASGDLFGELAEGSGVDGRSPAGLAGRHGDGHPVFTTDSRHRRIDERIEAGGIRGRGGIEQGEVAATGGGAFAGAERDLRDNVVGPALAELPRVLYAVGDVALALAGAAEHRAQRVADRVGEDGAEGAVRAGHAPDGAGQVGEFCFCCAVDRAEAELGAKVDKQLVTPRGDAITQCLDRVGTGDLVRADLGAQRDDEFRCGARIERDVVRARRVGSRLRRRRGSRRGGSLARRGVRRGLCRVLVLYIRFVLFVDTRRECAPQRRGIALDIEYLRESRTFVPRERERLRCEIRQRRRGRDAHLETLLDTEPAVGGRVEHQVLRLDPPDRARELPGQQLDEQEPAECIRLRSPVVPAVEDVVESRGVDVVRDLGNKLAVQREQAGNEVRDVAPDEHVDIDLVRDQRVESGAEFGHAVPQHLRVERHVDTRHQHEGGLPAVPLYGSSDGGLQSITARHGSGDRVLGSGEVVVDDLQELS